MKHVIFCFLVSCCFFFLLSRIYGSSRFSSWTMKKRGLVRIDFCFFFFLEWEKKEDRGLCTLGHSFMPMQLLFITIVPLVVLSFLCLSSCAFVFGWALVVLNNLDNILLSRARCQVSLRGITVRKLVSSNLIWNFTFNIEWCLLHSLLAYYNLFSWVVSYIFEQQA